jgi:hypothetical protein
VDSKAIRDQIITGQYRPDLNDEPLFAMDRISDVWPQGPPKDSLHVFVSLPAGMGTPTLVDNGGECFVRLFSPAQNI